VFVSVSSLIQEDGASVTVHLFSICSLVVLAVILPTAVEGLFPVIAVALGVSAVLIAKGIFWGAVIGGIIGGGYVRGTIRLAGGIVTRAVIGGMVSGCVWDVVIGCRNVRQAVIGWI
jgi:hypothetical protein